MLTLIGVSSWGLRFRDLCSTFWLLVFPWVTNHDTRIVGGVGERQVKRNISQKKKGMSHVTIIKFVFFLYLLRSHNSEPPKFAKYKRKKPL